MSGMLNTFFRCPECKEKLINTNSCLGCSKIYYNNEGFFDFTNTPIINTNQKFSKLLSSINSHGYSKAIKEFLKTEPEYGYRFNKKEGSLAFRAINKSSSRCLILNSDLGNIPENISQMYEEVYSLENDENKVLIQKFRFQENKIDNVVLVRSKHDSLPFPDKHFDLVVLNGIQIKKENGISKTKVEEFLSEIKRVLNTNGCLCAGLQNKRGLKIMQEKTEEGIDYEYYLNSFYGYNSLFGSLGFQVESYWVLPSHSKPHYSGKVVDDVSLKWFFQNFDKKFSVDTKFRIAGIFLKLLNNPARKLVLEFCPSFLFYCYNGEKPKVLEDIITENTGFENLIQNIRLNKILYILLDRNGNPRKVVSCQITKYDLTEKIFPLKRIFPKMTNLEEKIVVEEWLDGEVLDRLNVNDLKLTMKWLTDFQNNTISELLSLQEIEDEVTSVKNELDSIEAMSYLPYDKWLDEYKEELSSIKLKKTAVHGDFQVRNILIDHKNSLVNVIDWDWRYQEKGNPIYDFMWLATNIMMLSNNPIDEFRSNLDDNGKAVTAKRIIKETMKEHFHVDLDFVKLQKFMVLRFITIRIKDGDDGHLPYIEILKTFLDQSN